MLGQMMEPVEFSKKEVTIPEKPWATTGNKEGKPRNIINSLFLDTQDMENHVLKLFENIKR